jgi:hypothetical protein
MNTARRAYVLIELEPGKEKEFGTALSDILENAKGISKLDFVYGAFDVVMALDGEAKEVEDVILKVRTLSSVHKTETLLCFEKLLWEDLGGRLT